MNSVLLRTRTVLPFGAACLLLSPVLSAAPTATEAASDQLAEVVVTAQKREQRAQDVPISLSVIGGAELDKSSIQSVTDALGLIPGVATNINGQGGQTTLTVRGVAASGALFAGPSPIGYYLDAVPFGLVRSAVEPDANIYDLNRIEVLRGPQGTLYGASAMNGVVRVLTNDADVNEFDVKGRAGASTTDGGGGNWRSDMALNIPIIDGKLAARLVVGSGHDSGWIDAPVGTHINDTDSKNARLKITALPTDDLSIKLSAMHEQTDLGAPPTGTDDYSATLQEQPIKTRFNSYDVKVDYQAPSFTVSSASSYFYYYNNGTLDIDPGVAVVPPLTTLLTSRVVTEELNLTSRLQGPWRWSVGAFYRDALDFTYQTLGDLIPAPVSQNDSSKSYAVYGEVGRRFLDNQLELTVGARYFHDNVGLQQNILWGQPAGTPLIRVQTPFDATTPRVVLSWFPSHDYTFYASYSEGFRSGFPQSELVLIVDTSFVPVKPDKLHNFEIGGKGSVLDGRLVFDAAVYYMKWDDIQQTLGIPVPNSTAYIVASVNGKSASGMGVDFAVTAHPVEGLSLGVNFSWNALAEDSAVYSGGALLFPSGSRIDTSPEVTAGATAQYRFPITASGWTGQLEAIGRYTSTQNSTHTSTTATAPPVVLKSDVITTGRVDFAVTAPTHWRVMVYCNNVGNNSGVPLVSATPYSNVSQQPRTTGVEVDYRYK